MWLVAPQNGQKRAMVQQPDGWFKSDLSPQITEFYFESGAGECIDLGGTMGNYPADLAENFRTSHRPLWIKGGVLYTHNPETQAKPDDELVVLTINLHTYQEEDQAYKLNLVVRAIAELDADVVFLQEVAQGKDAPVVGELHGVTIRDDNMAQILVNQLATEYDLFYDFFWDWSHYGWEVWEEGSAVLTKHKIVQTEARFITKETRPTEWRSRKVPMITALIPSFGEMDLYSVHTGRWDDQLEPFKHQCDQLLAWMKERHSTSKKLTLLAGDFNNIAGSEGYDYIMNNGQFDDVYFKANPEGFDDFSIGGQIHGWQDHHAEGSRIDYIFIPSAESERVEVILAQRIFTEKSYGRVSDHNGQYACLKFRGKI